MNYFSVRLLVWVLAFFLCPIPASLWARDFQISVLGRITLAAPPPLPEQEPVRVDLTERVLLHLETAEKNEIDPWYRDDIRIAWITTNWAQNGVPEWFSWDQSSSPHVAATYQVLHCHPDAVWANITARRKAKLGASYAEFFPDGASSPKKPCVSVRTPRKQRAA
ncbi:MAG TPA: hypothetical protein VHZ28_06165 [Terracidiphilus sp.]|nr:hypothetical protein [Terracidiphilus sp.]